MLDLIECRTILALALTLLRLIGFKILGQPIHHAIDHLIQAILFHNTTFLTAPFGIVIPGKPRDGMETITIKDIASGVSVSLGVLRGMPGWWRMIE